MRPDTDSQPIAEAEARAEPSSERPRRRRGFAAMDKEQVSRIAGMGGRAAHARGTAHRFTSEEARVAGRKGGVALHRSRGRPRRERKDEPSG